MVGPSGVLRKALFSRGVAARLVAVRGLLYMIIQQLRAMDEGEAEEAMEADPELSCSQVSDALLANDTPHSALHEGNLTLLCMRYRLTWLCLCSTSLCSSSLCSASALPRSALPHSALPHTALHEGNDSGRELLYCNVYFGCNQSCPIVPATSCKSQPAGASLGARCQTESISQPTQHG